MTITLDLSGLLTAIMTAGISFAAAVIMAPGFIPMLRRMKFGQEVRDDGPQSHLKKQGTPTMGGIIFLISAVCASVIGMFRLGYADLTALQILFLTVGFGFVGFLDDYLKIKRKNTDGLKPKQKLLLQLLISAVFAVWVYCSTLPDHVSGRIYIPFTGNTANALYLDLPAVIFVPFIIFVVLGTDNGVNFADGLDGLCASVTSVVAFFFMLIGAVIAAPGLSMTSAAVFGGLLGYLLFNVYPAKVFMGDTGSLALGGFVAAAAVVTGMELYIPVFGFIYLAEVVSVIIQVTYFKKTHGKRFFKMAPIHHHFEMLGNSETRIVAAFTIVTLLLSMAAFAGCVYAR